MGLPMRRDRAEGWRTRSWWADNPPALDQWLARHDSARTLGRPLWRVLRAVLRAVVFLVGGSLGLVFAATIGYFGGGGLPSAIVWALILVSLALVVTAPVCWYFAVWGKAGDRWTLVYAGVWATLLGVNSIAVVLNEHFGPF